MIIAGGVNICKIKWSFYEVFWRSSSPSTVPVHRGGSGPKKTQAMLAQDDFNAGGSGAAIPSMTQLQSARKAVTREAAGSSGGTTFNSVRSLCVVLALFVISRAAMSLCVPTKYQRSICLDATRWLMCSSGPLNIRGQKHTSNPLEFSAMRTKPWYFAVFHRSPGWRATKALPSAPWACCIRTAEGFSAFQQAHSAGRHLQDSLRWLGAAHLWYCHTQVLLVQAFIAFCIVYISTI